MTNIQITEYTVEELAQMTAVWNEVVDDGIAFPQVEPLDDHTAAAFFSQQSFTGIAKDTNTGEVLGLYILHPNNVGRCNHIANASYAVKSTARGLKIGEKLVIHSLDKAKEMDFKIMQFNAVVKTNVNAIHLYEKLGFIQLGTIPDGFHLNHGYEDIIVFYRIL